MARPRRSSRETPYQRRIRLYLERNPGATRQEARGKRLPEGVRSEYARRIEGTEPGSVERREAAGKAAYKAEVQKFLRNLRDGAVVNVDAQEAFDSYDPKKRVFGKMTKWIHDGVQGSEGESYVFKGISLTRFRRLIQQETKIGVIFVYVASLNQRSLLESIKEEAEELQTA